MLARCFYAKQWCNFDLFAARDLVAIGIMQRLAGFNRSIPWPVHPSSRVSGFRHIHLKTLPPYPGLGIGQYIQAQNGIAIGEYVRIGPGVKLISSNHDLLNYEQHLPASPIRIGDFCWIGANAVILPGVTLGNHVVVAAGAVVTKSRHEDNILLAGIPAGIIKHLPAYAGKVPEHTIYVQDQPGQNSHLPPAISHQHGGA